MNWFLTKKLDDCWIVIDHVIGNMKNVIDQRMNKCLLPI